MSLPQYNRPATIGSKPNSRRSNPALAAYFSTISPMAARIMKDQITPNQSSPFNKHNTAISKAVESEEKENILDNTTTHPPVFAKPAPVVKPRIRILPRSEKPVESEKSHLSQKQDATLDSKKVLEIKSVGLDGNAPNTAIKTAAPVENSDISQETYGPFSEPLSAEDVKISFDQSLEDPSLNSSELFDQPKPPVVSEPNSSLDANENIKKSPPIVTPPGEPLKPQPSESLNINTNRAQAKSPVKEQTPIKRMFGSIKKKGSRFVESILPFRKDTDKTKLSLPFTFLEKPETDKASLYGTKTGSFPISHASLHNPRMPSFTTENEIYSSVKNNPDLKAEPVVFTTLDNINKSILLAEESRRSERFSKAKSVDHLPSEFSRPIKNFTNSITQHQEMNQEKAATIHDFAIEDNFRKKSSSKNQMATIKFLGRQKMRPKVVEKVATSKSKGEVVRKEDGSIDWSFLTEW